MQRNFIIKGLLFAILTSGAVAGTTPQTTGTFSVVYAGGNLPLKQDRAVKAAFGKDEVLFVQNGQSFAIRLRDIRQLAANTETGRRFTGPGFALVPASLNKKETRYVGVTWRDGDRSLDAIFRLSSSEYRDFLTAMEQATGKRAVDPDQTPTIVRYGR